MNDNDYISLLKEIENKHFERKEDKDKMLYNIKMPVSELYNGEQVFKQIAEYVYANNYEKAEKYLKKALRKDRFWILEKLRAQRVFSVIWMVLLMFVTSIILMFTGFNLTRQAKESVNWPKTSGHITKSFYTREVDDDYDVTFEPVTEYRYTVSGKEYISDQRNIGGYTGFEEESTADSIVKQYPKDSEVIVWYNPKKNEFAVLEPGMESRFHFTVYMAFVFFILSGILFFAILYPAVKRIKKEGKKPPAASS